MSATKFLQMKWRKGFRFIDRDRDGILTAADLESMADFISQKANASPEEAQISKAAWLGWMLRLQSETTMTAIDEDTHNDIITKLYRDVEEFKKNIAYLMTDIFDNIDMNKDGYISLEEMVIFYSGYGVTDHKFVRKVFDTMDKNNNGIVERNEFVGATVQYWTSPDESDEFAFMYDLPVSKHT